MGYQVLRKFGFHCQRVALVLSEVSQVLVRLVEDRILAETCRCNKRAGQSHQNWGSRGTRPGNGRSRLAVMVALTNTSQKT